VATIPRQQSVPARHTELLEKIAAGASQRERDDQNPFDVIDLVREARLGALRLPPGDGGAGVSVRELFAFVVDLAEADPVVPHILRIHYRFVEEQLISVDQVARAKWLREIADGRIFANASAELGSRPAGGSTPFATVLTADGDGYRLNGTKYYSTGTLFADWVVARVSHADGAVVTAIVPTSRKGVVCEDDWDGIGQRRTGSGTTYFRDVRVEPDEVFPDKLPGPGDGPGPASYFPTFLQLWLQAISAGILRIVVRDAVTLLRGRSRNFSHALVSVPAEDPVLHEVVGELSAAAYAAEALVLRAADSIGAAFDSVADGVADPVAVAEAALRAAQVKVHLDEVGLRAATLLFEVGGASAVKQSANLDRHWRNLRTLASHNPTRYKAQAIGAHLVTGRSLPGSGYF
jgi:alkylation response protein AidB-like acyl-CoA dehydrogenase